MEKRTRRSSAGQGRAAVADSGALLREICEKPLDQAYAAQGSRATGLTREEVEARAKEYGPNVLAGEKKKSVVQDLAGRLVDPLVVVLLVICVASFATGDPTSGFVVLGMIGLSVLLSFFQERRSSVAAEKLKMLVQASALVIRDGIEVEVAMGAIVPGDLVVLAAGSIIPADARIVSAKDFFVTQATLTGESMPVEKSVSSRLPETGTGETQVSAPAAAQGPGAQIKADVLSLANACFQGTTVVSGSARALVVSTGASTFLGAVAKDVAEPKGATEFDRGVKSFVGLMLRFMIVMVSVIFAVQGLFRHNWLEALLFGLSVAVGLTPGMLPMIVTVCLSKGAIFMSRKKVIVKKLKAIQNLGGVDVLCTDKTGTITQDRVILEKHVDVTNRPNEDVLRYAWMNSYYQTGLRSLLDESILSNEKLEVERSLRKVDEVPFDFVRKRMSVVVEYEGDNVLICKGSVEAIFEACDRYQVDDEIFPLIDLVKADILEEYRSLSSDGYRVLAIGYRDFPQTRETFSTADESGLIMLGYLAFLDPPKDSAAKAIASLASRGVRVKVLTGDNELVTAKVSSQVGFEDPRVIVGRELASLSEEDFGRAVEEHDVFARLTPADKERIVRALRARAHVVGFMGDGINDAPAMRAADVGISVDTAVDVAKESADIILLEKNLLVLEDGIVEGRKVFANIIKYIKMGASSNFGNMFSMLGSSLLLPFLPMTPVQILLNNLLYDVSQTGIPLDNVDREVLAKPRSWDISFIRRFMLRIGPISSIFDYATFALMWFVFGCGGWFAASPLGKAHYEALFHTGWFVESLLTQTLIVHIIRTDRIPFIQSRASSPMLGTTLLIMCAAVLLPYSPLAPFFGLVPLPLAYWGWIAAFLLGYSALTSLVKTAFAADRQDRTNKPKGVRA
ncbi:MAG TPA: magnesium-translocating P-type ATPase [Rectinemataceae bacterium]|nr:magnesium-translocating P-type ATPase [Rectinemataceae bacterium]